MLIFKFIIPFIIKGAKNKEGKSLLGGQSTHSIEVLKTLPAISAGNKAPIDFQSVFTKSL